MELQASDLLAPPVQLVRLQVGMNLQASDLLTPLVQLVRLQVGNGVQATDLWYTGVIVPRVTPLKLP